MKIKDTVYNQLVRKNEDVSREYERYVMEHIDEHYENRLKHWNVLRSLIWHYRIRGKKEPLLYWDGEQAPVQIQESGQQTTGQQALSGSRGQEGTRGQQGHGSGGSQEKKKAEKKLPYLAGAESDILKRPKPHHFVKQFLKYDIVSFDIFDTLLLRPLARPVDLFMIVGEKLGIMDFFNIRIEAERQAREIQYSRYGNREVNIEDIYKIIEQRTGIDRQAGIRAEFGTELELCHANPYMLRSYELLKDQGKKIILVSDMYLGSAYLRELLEKCGYTGYADLIVSCEHGTSKSRGGLYDVVAKKYSGESIVHIGDNPLGDVQRAKEHGISAYYYKNVNEAGMQYRADRMSLLVGSAYAEIVNAHLYNGLQTYSPHYEYGFTYGGIYILGYCSWIARMCKKNGTEKILFLARDGYIYQKVFEKLDTGMDHEYLYWSRIPASMLSARLDKHHFLDNFVYQKAGNKLKKTDLASLLKSIGLESFEQYLGEHKLSRDSILDGENASSVAEMFVRHWDEVVRIMEENTREILDYLKEAVRGNKKIAIVDVGWTGKNIMYLKKIIHRYIDPQCEVECFLAAFRSAANQTLELDESIHTYLFSYDYNRSLYDSHANKGLFPMNSVFEIFTQAPMPSFYGIREGKFQFDFPEVENYPVIREIDRGILDFADMYLKSYKNVPYMKNISGHDACTPYSMHIRNLAFYRRFFGDFCISLNTLTGIGGNEMETIGDILANPRKQVKK